MVAGRRWWHCEVKLGPAFPSSGLLRWEHRSCPDSDKALRKLLRTPVDVFPRGSWGFLGFFCGSRNGMSRISPAGAVALFQLISDSIREKNCDFYSRSVFFLTTQNCGIVGLTIVRIFFFTIYIICPIRRFKMAFEILLKTILVHTKILVISIYINIYIYYTWYLIILYYL